MCRTGSPNQLSKDPSWQQVLKTEQVLSVLRKQVDPTEKFMRGIPRMHTSTAGYETRVSRRNKSHRRMPRATSSAKDLRSQSLPEISSRTADGSVASATYTRQPSSHGASGSTTHSTRLRRSQLPRDTSSKGSISQWGGSAGGQVRRSVSLSAVSLDPIERDERGRATMRRIKSEDGVISEANCADEYILKTTQAAAVKKLIAEAATLLQEDPDADDITRALHILQPIVEKDKGCLKARMLIRRAEDWLTRHAVETKTKLQQEMTRQMATEMFGEEDWREAQLLDTRYDPTKDDLRRVFAMLDKDGSGTLDRDEISKVADFFSVDQDFMSDDALDAAMLEMDANGDGEVDLEEFEGWWAQRRSKATRALSTQGTPTRDVAGAHRASDTSHAEPAVDTAKGTQSSTSADRFSKKTAAQLRQFEAIDASDPRFVSHMQHVFNSFDRDQSGTISMDQLSGLVTQTSSLTAAGTVEELMQEVDADGGGDIDFTEFMHFMKTGGVSAIARAFQAKALSAHEELWAQGKIIRHPNSTFG